MVLCKNGLTYNNGFAVEGIINVVLDTKATLQVNMNEVFGMTNKELSSLKQEMNINYHRQITTGVQTGKNTSTKALGGNPIYLGTSESILWRFLN